MIAQGPTRVSVSKVSNREVSLCFDIVFLVDLKFFKERKNKSLKLLNH